MSDEQILLSETWEPDEDPLVTYEQLEDALFTPEDSRGEAYLERIRGMCCNHAMGYHHNFKRPRCPLCVLS